MSRTIHSSDPRRTSADHATPHAAASAARAPRWVWIVLSVLAAAILAVTIGLVSEAQDASARAKAASSSAAQLLDDLVADVKTTNEELATFNEQFASASASAKKKASSAQEKKPEGKSSSSSP
ncbi:MAG TPA: hypothetical protein VFL61_14805 [Gaiellaceae bacterium]|nr:hypothetical protein [Gaiellaceae bacterium]